MRRPSSARGADRFDARAETTEEQAAFALTADPRGYGNPDEGRRHPVGSTALEADPAPGAPEGLSVFAVRYGGDGGAGFEPSIEVTPKGPRVRTEAFTAVIDEVAGEAHGEPEPTLVGRAG